jgi:hypothetical protein
MLLIRGIVQGPQPCLLSHQKHCRRYWDPIGLCKRATNVPCTVALFGYVLLQGMHKLIHRHAVLSQGIVRNLNLACEHPSKHWSVAGPCGPRKHKHHECCRVLQHYLWYVLLQGMRVDPHSACCSRASCRTSTLPVSTLASTAGALLGPCGPKHKRHQNVAVYCGIIYGRSCSGHAQDDPPGMLLAKGICRTSTLPVWYPMQDVTWAPVDRGKHNATNVSCITVALLW